MKQTFVSGLFLAALCLPATAGFAAQEERERNLEAVHCVRIQNIRDIDIVNDRTLVFRMRNGDVYRNDLPRRCPGLDRRDPLMYRTSVGQLCSVDIITVLEDWGFGFAPGVSCGLGMFEPITPEIADELLREEG
ncbi:MAG TPA: hypothetical protein VKZ85_09070 [Woeseiaceae bacterium]|nr:hypothetical protein [Woeseiaceae bacterium]